MAEAGKRPANGGQRIAQDGAPRQGRARAQSNVGERLLQKRQSAYHGTPVNFQAGAIPPMPGLPNVPNIPNMPSIHHSPSIGSSGNTLEQDLDRLAADDYKPEDFLKAHLQKGGSDHMETFKAVKSSLKELSSIAEHDLQQSVYKNYADFVVISKEITTLENEMLEIKAVLEEWKAVPESLEMGVGSDDVVLGSGGNNRRNRNSIADLATLYKTQLASLWSTVESSQKLLPFVPNRHLISEFPSFTELNTATYKPRQNVHLFLLNDALLVAAKKRGTGQGISRVRLVAEKCFNLAELNIQDIRDGGDLINAIKMKRGNATMIFTTEKTEEKKQFLSAFKKVSEELVQKKRKELLTEVEARKGDIATIRGRIELDKTLAAPGFSPVQFLGVGKEDPAGKDLSWIDDYSDELSVAIATRSFDQAVTFIEKGKALLPHIIEDQQATILFRTKLDSRSNDLLNNLLTAISAPTVRKSTVLSLSSFLIRLGHPSKARETFLAGRSALVKSRSRLLKFEGSITTYISELSIVCFTLIRNTCEWYLAAFKDNRMASGFVRWASEQVGVFADVFRRQVYGVHSGGKEGEENIVEESLKVTKLHALMLREVGLDFTFLLESLLRPQVRPPPDLTSESLATLRPGRGKRSAVDMARQSVYMANGAPSLDVPPMPSQPEQERSTPVIGGRVARGGGRGNDRPMGGFNLDAISE